MLRTVATFFLCFSLFAHILLGQDLPDAAQLHAYAHFNEAHGGGSRIRWHHETTTPSVLYRFRSKAYIHLYEPETIARKFLEDERDLLRIDESNLVLLRIVKHKGIHHVSFQ